MNLQVSNVKIDHAPAQNTMAQLRIKLLGQYL